ncbi:response regulator [Ktedonospora formicarum]|uniref:DNA-binding response regulator n=1 Tax=Ktedonospora formicarum TaxID=2778364 RepID=A0A8J3I6W3_9CHLR|nr:response regulator transcription factor [Ktedonospora formicarum]GHO45804.1 DNA-binding response regulator [Ktedonospora formicarum]
MTDTIRILLCEDQTLMRQGLRTILELEQGLQVVGEAADGEEAVSQYNTLRDQGLGPDIVLMDVQMPRMSGVQATAVLTTSDAGARVIILTTFDYEDYVYDAIKAGAMGYLLKDVPADELVATIRQVYAGEASIQPKIANKLLMDFGRKGRASNTKQQEELSPREIEILKLLAEGASNRRIAEKLVLAEGTVKNHVSNILSKLHTENRTQAVYLARQRKLL